ncbi:hypothetical protein Tco_0689803 [Tanacetum coccineum]
MAALRYRDEHNKVGYLQKPTGSDDYHQILDFLRASHIRSPELGPPAILATIDKTPYTITEDSVRSQLQLADDGGIDDLPIADIYSGMDNLGTKSGSWDQFGSSLAVALICLSDGRRFNWSSYIFKGMFLLLLQKVHSLDTKLKAHKKLFQDVVGKLVKKVKAMKVKLKTKKRKVIVSDSDQEEGKKRKAPQKGALMDLDALIALANTAVTVDSNVTPGGPSNNPAASSHIPTDAPTGGDFAPAHSTSPSRDPFKLEALEREIFEKEKAEITRQDVIYAKQLEQEEAMSASQRKTRHEDVLSSAKHYSDADWIDIMAQVYANAGLSSELLGANVNDDNFAERMVALINQRKRAFAEQTAKEKRDRPMTPAQQREYMRVFVKNQSTTIYSTGWSMKYVKSLVDEQLIAEFEKIRMAVADIKSNELRRTLKRVGEALEPDTSKKQKSTEAPIPSSRITKPELDLDTDDKKFINVVSDEESKDEAPILWAALLDILKLYRLVVKHYKTSCTGLIEIRGDLQRIDCSQEGSRYVVPTGKDNFIVSAGRPNMVPAGKTIVSPGSIILGPVVPSARTPGDTIARTRFENVSKTSYDSPLGGVNTPRSDEDSMQLKELIEMCTNLLQREDASKQGRNIAEIDADVDISLVHKDAGIQGRFDDEDMSDTSVFNDEEVFPGQDMADQEFNVAEKEVSVADPVTTTGEVVTTASVDISTTSVLITVSTATPTTITEDDMTLAETLMEIKSAKPKAIGVVMQEPSEIPRISAAQQQIQEKAQGSRDKGKAKMVEEEEPKEPTKRKDQIKHDEDLAQRLKAQLQAEMEEEDRLARQREDEDNIVSWDNAQAMMEADYQMAERLQVEEQASLTDEEKARLFVQLLDAKKKHFAVLRAQEIMYWFV